MVFHTTLFVLTVVKLPERSRSKRLGNTVTGILIRDGMWAFVVILGGCCLSASRRNLARLTLHKVLVSFIVVASAHPSISPVAGTLLV